MILVLVISIFVDAKIRLSLNLSCFQGLISVGHLLRFDQNITQYVVLKLAYQ